jgi:YVTN family beta-propeller protein
LEAPQWRRFGGGLLATAVIVAMVVGALNLDGSVSEGLTPTSGATTGWHNPSTAPPTPGFFSTMVLDAANGNVYVADWDSSNITIVDGSSGAFVANVTVGLDPDALLVVGPSGNVFVANFGSNAVSVISGALNTVVVTISVGNGPSALSIDPANGDVYVLNFYSGNISVIDPGSDTVVGSVPAVFSADSLVADTDNGDLYVGNYAAAYYVMVIDGATNHVLSNVTLTGAGRNTPWALAYDPGNGGVYVPENDSTIVGVINGTTNTLLTSITVGDVPRAIAVDAANGDVYVANYQSSNVSVISGVTDTVVATIPVGAYPTAVVVDNATGLVYVANEGSNNVSVINGSTNTLQQSIRTGAMPSALVVDPVTGKVFVSDYGSSTTAVLAAPSTFALTFAESGIPAKTLAKYGWTVVLNGTVEHSTTAEMNFTEPNGTYPYLIAGPAGYQENNVDLGGSGTLTIDNGKVNGYTPPVNSIFERKPTSTLKFAERGLPKGQAWCVELEGWRTCSSKTTDRYLNLTPGTYSYSVVSPLGRQNTSQKVGKTTTYGANGTVALAKSTTVQLTFAYRYEVTFTETGAPAGTWSVTIKGHALSNATGDPIVFYLVNGTYAYKIGAELGYRSHGLPTKVLISGGPASATVTFTKK